MKMRKMVIVIILAVFLAIGGATLFGTMGDDTPPTEPTNTVMTVNDVLEKAGCDYFILKNIDTLGILESDIYMDREVVEINICDDTPNTLCLFIKLEPNEKEVIRK